MKKAIVGGTVFGVGDTSLVREALQLSLRQWCPQNAEEKTPMMGYRLVSVLPTYSYCHFNTALHLI